MLGYGNHDKLAMTFHTYAFPFFLASFDFSGIDLPDAGGFFTGDHRTPPGVPDPVIRLTLYDSPNNLATSVSQVETEGRKVLYADYF